MKSKIIYYVAITLDGFICRRDGVISDFLPCEELNRHYFEALSKFHATIMGRKTYEFGYQYGLKPGDKAYEHMDHYIFSSTLKLDKPSGGVYVEPKLSSDVISKIKERSTTDIYLCGGGKFATEIYSLNLIDEIWLKVNPVLIGDGVRFLETNDLNERLELLEKSEFSSGIVELRYRLKSRESKEGEC